jgi:hypothetical protein
MAAMARFNPAQPLVHPRPDPDRVELRPGPVYTHAGGRALAMDVYLPAPRPAGTLVPAVLLVHGEADPELLRGVRGWGQYTGWGRLLAGQGLAFEHRAILDAGFGAVVAEVHDALAAVRERAGDLGLNRTIDDFVAAAEQRELAVELVHQPDGHHAFDVADDSDASREVIERVVAFLRGHLGT